MLDLDHIAIRKEAERSAGDMCDMMSCAGPFALNSDD